MKRNFIIKICALALALITAVCPLFSCAGTGKPALALKNNTISVGVYSLMASVLKGSLAYGNSNIGSDSFWETVVDSNGTTCEEYYNDYMIELAKDTLYKLALFDEKGLTLPQSAIDKIDEELEYWVDYDGEGSVSNFNSILAAYGANYDILREYMIISAKLEYLASYMYGDGSRISDEVKQNYLDGNYVCFKQILIPYYEYVYEKDADGKEIYYLDNGAIAYDEKNGEPVDSDGDGKYNRDKNDAVIYYEQDENGKVTVCYDKVKGTRRVLTENGNAVTNELDAKKKSEAWNLAQKVYGEIQTGNFNGFEVLLETYDENIGNSGRIYLNKNVSYLSAYGDETVDKLRDSVDAIKVGEATMIETENGMHIMMRYSLESKAWSIKENAGFFIDESGISDFSANLISELFAAEIESVKARVGEVTVYKENIAEVSIKKVGVNYNFY